MANAAGIDVDIEFQSFISGFFHGLVGDIGHHGIEVESDRFQFEHAGLDFREIEDVVDQGQQMPAGAMDFFDIVALSGIKVCSKRQVRHADDAVHRCADFVAHVGKEFAFGSIGRFRGLLRLQQGAFGRFLGRNVNQGPDQAVNAAVGLHEHGLVEHGIGMTATAQLERYFAGERAAGFHQLTVVIRVNILAQMTQHVIRHCADQFFFGHGKEIAECLIDAQVAPRRVFQVHRDRD